MVPHFSKAAAMVFRPLHAQVSEFQYKYRANTLILTGLWFENQKPAMNTFLLPFVLKMNDLSSSDVKLQDSDGCERPMKVYFGLCTVDCAYVKLWAWANLMGSVATLGARPSRVQVVVRGTGYLLPCLPCTKICAKAAHKWHVHRAGPQCQSTRHESKLWSERHKDAHTSDFTSCSGFVIDYMHAVCSGFVKATSLIWLNSRTS